MDAQYRIGNITFESLAEYQMAVKELKQIKTICNKLDLDNIDQIKGFLANYNKSNVKFTTKVGNSFILGLNKKVQESEKEKSYSNKPLVNSNTPLVNSNKLLENNNEPLTNSKKTLVNDNKTFHNDTVALEGIIEKNQPHNANKIKKSFLCYLPIIYLPLLVLFPVPVGMLVIGIAIIFGLKTIIEYIVSYSWIVIIIMVLSIAIPPLGVILTIIGIIKKGKYIITNGRMIFSGFVFYLGTAYLELQLFNMRYDQYGMPGIVDVIYQWRDLTMHNLVGWKIAWVIIYAIILLAFLGFSLKASNYLDRIIKINVSRGISAKQTIFFILKSPFVFILMFLPAILGSLSQDIFDNIENNELDIDNNDHEVRPFTRHMSDGKEVHVSGHRRMNPDDIVENNYSYQNKK
jgi:hypothetical protein